ncbi:MAG: cobalamin biosynthesis protein P47K [Blastocatellia bacterium]|nr:MAG: cobalamin biosynthesis protein P47K [Blastocatellia bacterium]
MVGGFLGAGKTTALLRLAEHFTAQGRRVGLITNDQSQGLVDTSIVSARGYPVEEITGGCFCCRFRSLTDAADRLTRDARPEVFLAEPVGSCTDLRATVQYPLRRLYGDDYRVAPLSVLVDPLRAARMLGLEEGRAFSPKVKYVYEKQLEEADIIVINKSDLLSPERRDALERALKDQFRHTEVVTVSARTGTDLDVWFGRLSEPLASRPAMAVDYDLYAEGEALLGWLNATCRLLAVQPFDGNFFVQKLADRIQRGLAGERIEIAHFKMTLSPDHGSDLAVLNLVRTDGPHESPHLLGDELTDGELILNLRAEGDPVALNRIAMRGLEEVAREAGVTTKIEHSEHFRPARPEPTHRMAMP